MRAIIDFKDKDIVIDDVEKVSGTGNFFGLMFKPAETNALLFSFSEPCRKAIHSFFTKPFLAVWIKQGKIVEYKLIDTFKLSIRPESEFDKLLEIPINEKYAKVVNLFLTE